MVEENDPARRAQKRRLRRRILPDLNSEEIKDQDAVLRRRRNRRFLGFIVILLVLLLVLAARRTILRSQQYTKSEVVWENGDVSGSSVLYENFGGNILKVTGEGISCLDEEGTVLWNTGYSMANPTLSVRGSYGAVADIGAETAMIFGTEGILGTVNTTLSILNLSVSSHGVLALVLDDTDVNYITFYENTGNELDIRIKTQLSGDGYPLDIALTPEGTGLIASYVYLDQGNMQNQISFYNFDVGKDDSDRLVGCFTYGETMFPEVACLSDTVACAYGDDQVILFSLTNESKPDVIEDITVESEIVSVLTGETRVGIICQGESGRELTVYNTAGKEIFTAPIDFDYTHAEFAEENTILYGGSECLILGGRGAVRFEGSLEGDIQKLIYSGERSLLLFDSTSMKRLRLS